MSSKMLAYGSTVRVVVPETPPVVALMVVCPAFTPVASPLVALALLMVATFLFDELQVTDFVRSCVELSE